MIHLIHLSDITIQIRNLNIMLIILSEHPFSKYRLKRKTNKIKIYIEHRVSLGVVLKAHL